MSAGTASCGRCGSAVEAGDLRCPVCYFAVLPDRLGRPPSVEAQVLRCRSCGAAMEYRAEVEALQCAFCGGVDRVGIEPDPMEQTEMYLLFTVDREEAVAVYRRWLGTQGFFRPSDLASASRLESLRALWWVGWVFDADAEVTWTADSDAGARRAKWAPHAGEFRLRLNDVVVPATRGLSAAECAQLVPTYALGSGVKEPTGPDGGILRERFEMPRSRARARILETIRVLAEARVKAGSIPGSRFRNVHTAIRLRGLVTRRFAFPAYVLAYRYRDRLFRTVISGQEPSCVHGEAPRSVAKMVFAAAAAALALAAMVAVLIQRGFGGF